MEEKLLPKKMYKAKRNGTLIAASIFGAIAIPFAVLSLLGSRGGDLEDQIGGIGIFVFLILGTIWFFYEGIRIRSICLTLFEEGFTYCIFPKGERAYRYSDCVSRQFMPPGKYQAPNILNYTILMNDGSRLLVDNHMLHDGFGVRIGFYDGSLPEAREE
ncbi:MAG: hypothetical protein K6G56_01000 [Clostridiales bacterium]|nr:hypothetical protein [Clostridiales bacterium]